MPHLERRTRERPANRVPLPVLDAFGSGIFGDGVAGFDLGSWVPVPPSLSLERADDTVRNGEPNATASDRSSPADDSRGERKANSSTAGSDESELEAGNDGEATVEVDAEADLEVTFLDCETVRIEGSVDEVILAAFWWDESGLPGTIAEPIGGVDGERVISVSDAFGSFVHGPILSEVQGFRAGTPTVPGNGDWTVSNPHLERCIERVRDRYDGPGDLEGPFPDAKRSERKG
ncbi:hypothetical protein SAMN05444422_10372 [Halobiforma haloterrestris]|uniref:Uncharacterized protein n=1 Tax=Natronobacterium haloterrestre TaxID=148448 RepID=A0A1I1EZK1_NATHA|nr:hypothetical protein [Halobiforma haloterrestris]SFB92575.1 hypothetical protein SAMN05444422_10372 [Halobiforma haloterrestris]